MFLVENILGFPIYGCDFGKDPKSIFRCLSHMENH